MVSVSALAPPLPMWILLSPARTATPAAEPKAMLPEPVVFKRALAPTTVLPVPVVLVSSAPKPIPVLLPPVVLLCRA